MKLVHLGTYRIILGSVHEQSCTTNNVAESYSFPGLVLTMTDEGSDITTWDGEESSTVKHAHSHVVKNPVTGSLGLPSISIAVGVTVKENISHTLRLVQLNFICFSVLNVGKSQQVHSFES